jgi:ASC-1-like (ASCH) protein
MNVHELHCQEPWFSLLREGKKSVIGRLNNETSALIKTGDQIKFFNDDKNFLLTVFKIEHFSTISIYLETVGLQNALPGIKTIKEGCKVFLEFHTQEEIKKYGVLAFWVQ